jgi:hypothetical protein
MDLGYDFFLSSFFRDGRACASEVLKSSTVTLKAIHKKNEIKYNHT